MVSSRYGARLSQTDVADLATASEQLVVAANTIRQMHPNWGEAVVNLLIAVNQVIVRLQDKGASAFARYLEKHGLNPGLAAPCLLGPGSPVPEGQKPPQNEEET